MPHALELNCPKYRALGDSYMTVEGSDRLCFAHKKFTMTRQHSFCLNSVKTYLQIKSKFTCVQNLTYFYKCEILDTTRNEHE